MIAVIVLALFLFPFTGEHDFSWWFGLIFPILTGVMMAIGPIWFSRTYRLLRGYVYAALILVSALVIPLSGFARGARAVGCDLVGERLSGDGLGWVDVLSVYSFESAGGGSVCRRMTALVKRFERLQTLTVLFMNQLVL